MNNIQASLLLWYRYTLLYIGMTVPKLDLSYYIKLNRNVIEYLFLFISQI